MYAYHNPAMFVTSLGIIREKNQCTILTTLFSKIMEIARKVFFCLCIWWGSKVFVGIRNWIWIWRKNYSRISIITFWDKNLEISLKNLILIKQHSSFMLPVLFIKIVWKSLWKTFKNTKINKWSIWNGLLVILNSRATQTDQAAQSFVSNKSDDIIGNTNC